MLKKMFSQPKKFFLNLLPICSWGKQYDVATGVGDLIAGVTIALTLIPQSIAYSSLAGLEPQYGLYASFIGGFIYAFMGTVPQINIGPTALLSLLTFTYTGGMNADFAILLCFIGGLVQLFAGVLQLSYLVEFVSIPVVSGFTSAAAITIASSQVKGLLGLKFEGDGFMETWKNIFRHMKETKYPDLALSVGCCCVLMGMKAMKDIKIREPSDLKKLKQVNILRKSLWFIGVARNAVVVVLAATIAFFLYDENNKLFTLTGKITPGLPTPRVPPFFTTVGNKTFTTGEMIAHMGSGLLVVPIVGIIANVAIAKAFSTGKTLAATQEIIALAVCNIVGSFFSSYPVNGSFTRSAVSNASGVRTPAAGFCTGIIVLLTLALLTKYFFFIPKAALSSVIVCAVLHMVDLQIVVRLWRTSKLDLITLFGTFVTCLAFGVEIGLVFGVIIDMILSIYLNSKPPIEIRYVDDGCLPPHYAVYPLGTLNFAGAERVRSTILSLREPNNSVLLLNEIPDSVTISNSNLRNNLQDMTIIERSALRNKVHFGVDTMRMPPNLLLVHCDGLYRMDYTFLLGLKMMSDEWKSTGRIIWCYVRPDIKSNILEVMPKSVFCDNYEELMDKLVDTLPSEIIENNTAL